MKHGDTWTRLTNQITECDRCDRLVHDRQAAPHSLRRKPGPYWAKPVVGFGKFSAQILIVGLAPGPHGANRTGRAFSGDDASARLFDALYRAELSNRPESTGPGDGLELTNCYVTNLVKCSPANHVPVLEEQANCAPFLRSELDLLDSLVVVVALGETALKGVGRACGMQKLPTWKPRSLCPEPLPELGVTLLHTYHPSLRAWNLVGYDVARNLLDQTLSNAIEIAGKSH